MNDYDIERYYMKNEQENARSRNNGRVAEDESRRQMRIVQVLPYFYPHLGGVETHTKELSRKLAAKGHDVHVLTAMFQEGLPETEEMDGFKVHRVSMFRNLFLTPIIPSVKKAIAELEPDIVHVHSPPPLTDYYTARHCTRNKIPFALTYHCDLEIPIPFGSALVSLYRMLLGRYPVKKADALIYTSRSYAATSQTLWDREGVIIPNAVDVEVFNPDNVGSAIRERYGLGDSFVVMYVGRLVHHKGLESMILSARHTSGNIRYLIVGEGNMLPRLKNLAGMEGVEDKIVFTGRVKNEDLPLCYGACDCLILPSISRLEAFGIVGLEAQASGKPVILAAIPGVRDVIEDLKEGVICEPADPEDIAEKIMMLAGDESLRKEMGRRGRERVMERFSWDRVVDDIEELYFKMVNREK